MISRIVAENFGQRGGVHDFVELLTPYRDNYGQLHI